MTYSVQEKLRELSNRFRISGLDVQAGSLEKRPMMGPSFPRGKLETVFISRQTRCCYSFPSESPPGSEEIQNCFRNAMEEIQSFPKNLGKGAVLRIAVEAYVGECPAPLKVFFARI